MSYSAPLAESALSFVEELDSKTPVFVRQMIGLTPYEPAFEQMKAFTEHRTESTADEVWIVQHEPVYTQGQAGKPEHVLNPHGIPVVQCNRGGQVTYHGPGQVVMYPLLQLSHYGLYVKEYVRLIEETCLIVLRECGVVNATRKEGAPGIYVPMEPNGELAKIAALGVKVTHGCTYHGLAFNVDMDLTPFQGINPCGYAGLRTIDLKTLGIEMSWQDAANRLLNAFLGLLKERLEAHKAALKAT